MKILFIVLIAILSIIVFYDQSLAVGAGRGIGSDQSCHNFSDESWLPVTRICNVCHIPHRRRKDTRYEEGLSWSPKVTAYTYNIFNSFWGSSLTGIRDTSYTAPITNRQSGLPDGLSKLCLTCHNGIIAPDIFTLHHFISVDYDITKTELRDPDLTQMGVSGPISGVLHNGKIQCSSCHDAHDEESVAGTKLLRVEKSKICITCHKR